MTPEKIIETAILAMLERQWRLNVWKVDRQGTYDPKRKCFRANKNPFKRKGIPDINGILPWGQALYIEVKAPGKYPSKEQKEFIARAKDSGAVAFVARSIEDVYKAFKEANILERILLGAKERTQTGPSNPGHP